MRNIRSFSSPSKPASPSSSPSSLSLSSSSSSPLSNVEVVEGVMEVVEVGQPPTNDVGIQQPPPSLPSTFLIFPAKNPLSSSNTLTSRTRAAGTTKEMDVIHKLVQRLNVVGNATTISEGADGSSSREGGAAEATTEMSVTPPSASPPTN